MSWWTQLTHPQDWTNSDWLLGPRVPGATPRAVFDAAHTNKWGLGGGITGNQNQHTSWDDLGGGALADYPGMRRVGRTAGAVVGAIYAAPALAGELGGAGGAGAAGGEEAAGGAAGGDAAASGSGGSNLMYAQALSGALRSGGSQTDCAAANRRRAAGKPALPGDEKCFPEATT